MFWNIFFERAITLNFWFMAADKCFHDCQLVWLLSILICMYPFYPYFYRCLLVWMLKHQKYWDFCCWKRCDINTKSWIVILSTITNIATKQWIPIFAMTILQLKFFKTQVTANTRALIYLKLYGSVAKRIIHMVFNIPYLS